MEIKPCCHYCEEKTYVRRHGKSRAGIRRYLCVACHRTFQANYLYQGNESDIHRLIKKMWSEGKSNEEIARQLGVGLNVIGRHMFILTGDVCS
ncbi:IS1/IS1595 family N-terminal zinc-binding domain-containing protein [Budvicia aquatica]|uniref:IS1/IS1595 family N-terminal zinc-binding domain-containing protein n=1 Tax=Budvicia aquatica TaxID=82979 RepID=UPI0008FBE3CF|nr:hypothetical protein [Budvicia aquatica]